MKIKQPQLNFLIDILAFIAFVLLVSTGVLMHWILPAGTGRSLSVWGMNRHDWGDIHFWTSMSFLGFMSIHVLLHWKWILAMVRGKDAEQSGRRLIYGIVALVGLLLIVMMPFFAPVEQAGKERGGRQESGMASGFELKGSMTLEDVENLTGMATKQLLRKLDLPEDVSRETRLSHLRKQYGISMQEIRAAVSDEQ